MKRLPIAIFLLILLAPFQELTIPGLPIFVPFSYIVGVFVIVGAIGKGQPIVGALRPALILLLLIALASILQTYVFPSLEPEIIADYGLRGSRNRGWYQLAGNAFLIMAGLAVGRRLQNRDQWTAAVMLVFRVGVAIAFFAMYEVLAKIFDLPLVFPSTNDPGYRSAAATFIGDFPVPRPYGTFFEPGLFTSYLVHVGLLGIALPAEWFRSRAEKVISLGALFVAAGLASPLPAVGFFSVGILRLGTMKRYRLRAALLALVFGAGFVVFQATTSSVAVADFVELQRLRTLAYLGLVDNPLEAGAKDMRATGREMAMAAFYEYPILGVGLGNEIFRTRMIERDYLAFGSGSTLITLLTEMGLVGLVCVALIGRQLWIRIHRPFEGTLKIPDSGAIAGGIGFALMSSLLVRAFRGGPPIYIFETITLGLLLRLTLDDNHRLSSWSARTFGSRRPGAPPRKIQ